MLVEVQILDPRLHQWGLPNYQSEMAAGIDLFACIDSPLLLNSQSSAVLIPSGIAVRMPSDTMMAIVVPRSGLGHKKGLVLGNSVGIIDADYTGQIFMSAWNRNASNTAAIEIAPGDRIAQLIFVPIVRPSFTVVEQLSDSTVRGAAGFGSTGT